MKKSIVKVMCFLIILFIVLSRINHIFKFKLINGTTIISQFYELEPNTVDVLVLGTSHAHRDIHTGVLWNEYGIASFDLGGAGQPIWCSYYYLKEALKTQKPQLILLEGYAIGYSSEYAEDTHGIRNTFGLKWSKNRIDAIKASFPEERWNEFLIPYIQYHTRYTDLSRADFFKDQGNPQVKDYKGFQYAMATQPLEMRDVSDVIDRGELTEKNEKYYRLTLELAKENEIPIWVLISPYQGISADEQTKYNTVGDIAHEYGMPFINYNLLVDDIGLDYATDVAEWSHLNHRGVEKFTRVIGEYIKENYDIPDHRGDPKYQTWQNDADYLASMLDDQELKEATNLYEIVEKIQNPNFTLIVSVDGNCTTEDEALASLFDSLGIPRNGQGGFWYITNPVGIHYSSGPGEAEKYMRQDYHDFHMARTLNEEPQTYINTITIDNQVNQKVANGVNLRIYDNVTQTLVDSFGFDMDKSYELVR